LNYIKDIFEESNTKKIIEKKDKDYFPEYVPLELLESINKAITDGETCRYYFDELARDNSATVEYSTFSAQSAYDFSRFYQYFYKSGDGIFRQSYMLTLVTLGEQNCTLSSKPSSSKILANFLLWFPSNVGENFYIIFSNNERKSISIRFSNSYISFCEDGSTIIYDLKKPVLFSIALEGDYASIFLDGILRRKFRTDFSGPYSIAVKMVGETGKDIEGSIMGVEIWSLSKPFKGFSENHLQVVYDYLDYLVENNNITEIYRLLQAIEELKIDNHVISIFNLLKNHLQTKGFLDWLFEYFFSILPQKQVKDWKEENKDLLPDPIVKVDDLTVEFYKFPNKRFSLKVLLSGKIEKFNVLKDINIRVYPGDIIGIVGANGAGKSTLLKTIAGLVPIKRGRIELHGWHLLLSPGLGIRPELTGRENIYLAGSFFGLSNDQIDKVYQDIVDFSELHESIEKPFKFYSDGMKSRLIFSLATSFSPEILMLDELLSAGDIKFMKKASIRMNQMLNRANAVIIVTHSTGFVLERCNKAVLISKGNQVVYGDPRMVISRYLNELHMDSTGVADDYNNPFIAHQGLEFGMNS